MGYAAGERWVVGWNEAETPTGNHDRFPTLPNGKRDIIHTHNHVDTWKLMEKLVDTGKTKSIGVSNVGAPAPRAAQC